MKTDQSGFVEQVYRIEQYVQEMRGYFHEHPELSHQEVQTSKILKQEVTKLGLEIEEVSRTGFIATLDTGRPGKVIALRTDIDALPIQENKANLSQAKKWYSKNKGVCHACGHDAHMSMLLGAMKVLAELKDEFNGKILFLFEEGEETGSGITGMLNALFKKQVDGIYGTHVVPTLSSGNISVDSGPVMAGFGAIEFNVIGKGGHGSRPDLAYNPIFAATQVLNGIMGAWSNQIDVTKTLPLSFTQIQGGTSNNIIPESVYISGSFRYFHKEEGEHALEVIKKIGNLMAEAHNCRIEFTENFGLSSAPVVNDDILSKLAQNSIQKILPGALVRNVQLYASESFSKYSIIAPTVFAFLGVGDESMGSGSHLHTPEFDIDETALKNGVMATARFAIDFLQRIGN